MQIRHQRLHLLRRQFLLEAGHLGAANQDDVGHALVVCRHAVLHVWALEQAGEAGAAKVARAVCVVTFGATCVVNPPTEGLLWIEPEFGIRFARLSITSGEEGYGDQDTCRCKGKPRAVRLQTGPSES